MRKLRFYLLLFTGGLLAACHTEQLPTQQEIAPGVIKLQAGEIDTYTPYALFGGKPALGGYETAAHS